MSPAVRWIGIIVGLLVGNVVAMVILATVANRSNAQVIPQYYEQAVHYDDKLAEAAHNGVLGWTTTATLSGGSLEVNVRDATGAVMNGARVRVSGYQRAQAARTYDVVLSPVGEGTYRGTLTEARAGVHDMTVVVERAGDRFTQQLVVEAR